MKKLCINLWGIALTCAALTATGVFNRAEAREVYNIGAGWTFFTAEEPTTDNASKVNLPHIQTVSGTVNYMKEVDIPLAWEGKRVFLRVGGAARVADVFVGGAHLATHRGGDSAFTIEITGRVKAGTPVPVRIVVDSSPGLDILPTAGGEKTYGGVFRSVELIVCEPLSVSPAASLAPVASGSRRGPQSAEGGDGVWITTDHLTSGRAEGHVRLALLTPSEIPFGATARVRFLDADGKLVAQNSRPVTSSTLTIPFTLSNPRLWQGTDAPYLYDVEVTLSTGGGIPTDSLSVATGFRTVAMDGKGNFTLNGKPTKIHGVILHRDRMMVGTALTPFQIEEDVAFVLEMGANAVRVAGGQHSDYFYTLCDEAGLLVWNDGPFTGAAYPTDIDFVDTEAFRESGRRQFGEMVSQLYNHPSVVMWGVFSNVTTRTGNPVPYIRELNELVRELDSGRLTAASSVLDGEVNFITDLVSFNLALGWESGHPDGVVPWLEQLRRGWPDLRAGISYAAGASIFHQSERAERPQPTSTFHPEGWQTFFHEQYMLHAVDAPGLWGVFVGDMFDSGAAKVTGAAAAGSPATSPSGAGGIDDRGLVTFDRKDRKDAFWLYKAGWNRSEPFVRIVGSRLDTRSERRQTVRVYSNLSEVELFMGGRSQGHRESKNGIFVWENVNMRSGMNRLEARATGVLEGGSGAAASSGTGAGPFVATDRSTVTISPGAATTIQPSAPSTTSTTTTPIVPISPVN